MTKKKCLMVIALPLLALPLLAASAWAAGFQLPEQNAGTIGNAFAGTAATAENASTIFFNPAGMTQLQAREISLGVAAIQPSIKFHNSGSTNPLAFGGGPATGNDGGDAGGWNFVPNGYLSWALNKDIYIGIGVGAPFGLATEYDSAWYGRYQAVKFDIKTYNVNPSIAYRVNDKLSLGFGLNWQRMDVEYVRQAHPALGQVTLNADDDAWGWNIGALLQVTPATRIGVSYRSKMDYTLEGDIAGSSSLGLPQLAKADITLPDVFIFSVMHNLTDRWTLLGDLSWTGWSRVDTVNITNMGGTLIQPLDAKWDDTWRFSLGANYKFNEAWKIRCGASYEMGAPPDAEHRLVSLPDNDRIFIAGGVQWKPNKVSTLDFSAGYLFVNDSDINNNQEPTRGIVKGSFDMTALILGAQYSFSF